MLDAALEGARREGAHCEKIILSKLRFGPCNGCARCARTGVCRTRDDFKPLYTTLRNAELLLIASPLYFRNLSSATKAFIDRLQAFWVYKHVLHKRYPLGKRKGAFLCASASNDAQGFKASRLSVRAGLSVMDVALEAALYVPGVEHKNDIRKKPEALVRARALGRRLARHH